MKTWKFSHDRLPLTGEICTVAPINMVKPAALIFDRVHVTTREKAIENEIFSDVPEEFTFCVLKASWDALAYVQKHYSDADINLQKSKTHQRLIFEYASRNIKVIPTYESDESFRKDFSNGINIAYQAALNNIPVASPERLSWDQIRDFRNDKDAASKYRDLRLWFKDLFITDSIVEATDRIAQRIERYQWAIDKHGIETKTGIISEVLSWENLAVFGATAALLREPIAGLLAGTCLSIAKYSIKMAKRQLDLETIKREQFPEIAVLLEVQKLLKK
jgi:hypothetical protein